MAQQATADGGRTETERFDTDVDAEDSIEGDRISPALVAPHMDVLGSPIRRTMPDEDGLPETQLVVITATDRMDDTHSALLADPETGTIVRAGRHDSQQAWSQAEADWTVRDVGTSVSVTEVHEIESLDEEIGDEQEWAQTWAEIVLEDVASGHDDYSDERELVSGDSLRMRDVEGREMLVDIELEEE